MNEDHLSKLVIIFNGEELELSPSRSVYNKTYAIHALKEGREYNIFFKPFKNEKEVKIFEEILSPRINPALDSYALAIGKDRFIRQEDYLEVMIENGILVYRINLDAAIKNNDFINIDKMEYSNTKIKG